MHAHHRFFVCWKCHRTGQAGEVLLQTLLVVVGAGGTTAAWRSSGAATLMQPTAPWIQVQSSPPRSKTCETSSAGVWRPNEDSSRLLSSSPTCPSVRCLPKSVNRSAGRYLACGRRCQSLAEMHRRNGPCRSDSGVAPAQACSQNTSRESARRQAVG